MDNFKLQEELKALESVAEHLEQQLKLVSLELCDLPDDLLSLVEKCVDIQMGTELHELSLNYLREFYYTKKRDAIEHKLLVAQQKASLQKLKTAMEETDNDIQVLENFKTTVTRRLISDAALQRDLIGIGEKSKALLDRQRSLKVPQDFSLEALIDKLELLEQQRSKKLETK